MDKAALLNLFEAKQFASYEIFNPRTEKIRNASVLYCCFRDVIVFLVSSTSNQFQIG